MKVLLLSAGVVIAELNPITPQLMKAKELCNKEIKDDLNNMLPPEQKTRKL